MADAGIQTLENRVARQDVEITNLQDSVGTIASSIKELTGSISAEFADVRKALEHKQNNSRQQVFNVLGIMVPVALGVGGILWGLIMSNASDASYRADKLELRLEKHNTAEASRMLAVETKLAKERAIASYQRGLADGQISSLNRRVDQIETHGDK